MGFEDRLPGGLQLPLRRRLNAVLLHGSGTDFLEGLAIEPAYRAPSACIPKAHAAKPGTDGNQGDQVIVAEESPYCGRQDGRWIDGAPVARRSSSPHFCGRASQSFTVLSMLAEA